MPPRAHLAEVQADGVELTFWNQSRCEHPPVDWNRDDLEHSALSWRFCLHYMEYLEVFGDEAFETWVLDWIDQNPPYEPDYWRYGWHSYPLSIRCLVWMQQIAVRRERLSATFRERAVRSLSMQLHFLERNLEQDVLGNHLLKNLKTLLWASQFFDGSVAERWGQQAERLLERELREQVLADGLHYERTPAYHSQVFVDLLEIYSVLPDGPCRRRLEELLPRMAQALADLTHPDGLPSLFNDGGLHMSYAPAVCLAAWRRLSGQQVQPRDRFALHEAGYFGMRGEHDYVVVDCGPVSPDFLPAHAQGDILSFEWTVGRQRVVIDAGVFQYDAGGASSPEPEYTHAQHRYHRRGRPMRILGDASHVASGTGTG